MNRTVSEVLAFIIAFILTILVVIAVSQISRINTPAEIYEYSRCLDLGFTAAQCKYLVYREF